MYAIDFWKYSKCFFFPSLFKQVDWESCRIGEQVHYLTES